MKKKLIVTGIVIISIGIITFLLPLPEEFRSSAVGTTRIVDRNGKELFSIQRGGLHNPVSFHRIPQDVIDALVSVEDRTFYSHPGLSLRGLVRAAWHDLKAMSVVEGGSTITQQLVRAKLQPKGRTVFYKIREMWLALKVDSRMTKQEILADFLESVFFGNQAYGIEAASETFLGKDISRVSLSEGALLIGLINAPTSLNPYKNVQGAVARRDLVLGAMNVTGTITDTEYEDAKREPVRLSHGRVQILAPHFVQWVQSTHAEEVEEKTLIETTLDVDLQLDTERIIKNQLEKLKDKNVTSAAVVVLDAKTGDVLTMVGSADFFDDEHDGQVNVAVANRQPGSAIKPFTYALALEDGMTAASTIADIETQFFTAEGNPYIPRNYDYDYHGLVRIREALANSYNIAAVKVLEIVGVPTLHAFLKEIGLSTLTESPEHYGLALTLGDAEVKLLELSAAFGIFPRAGITLHPRALKNGKQTPGHQVLDPKVGWIISDILSDNEARIREFGADSALTFKFPAGAKTGTTRNSRDNWTIGFTPLRIVGVWVGNADNSPMKGTSGVTGAGPIFHDVMERAMKDLPKNDFTMPEGIVTARICMLSGKLQTDLCPEKLTEYFIQGTEPQMQDSMYQNLRIDSRNGYLWVEGCDAKYVTTKTFTVFPPELKKWARDNGFPVPPEKYSPLCSDNDLGLLQDIGDIFITRPGPNSDFLLDPLIPDESEKIIFEARTGIGRGSAEWLVDGIFVGSAEAPDFRFKWQPKAGTHTVKIQREDVTDSITITVRKGKPEALGTQE